MIAAQVKPTLDALLMKIANNQRRSPRRLKFLPMTLEAEVIGGNWRTRERYIPRVVEVKYLWTVNHAKVYPTNGARECQRRMRHAARAR